MPSGLLGRGIQRAGRQNTPWALSHSGQEMVAFFSCPLHIFARLTHAVLQPRERFRVVLNLRHFGHPVMALEGGEHNLIDVSSSLRRGSCCKWAGRAEQQLKALFRSYVFLNDRFIP